MATTRRPDHHHPLTKIVRLLSRGVVVIIEEHLVKEVVDNRQTTLDHQVMNPADDPRDRPENQIRISRMINHLAPLIPENLEGTLETDRSQENDPSSIQCWKEEVSQSRVLSKG